MSKTPVTLSLDDLADAGLAASHRAAREALSAGVHVEGWAEPKLARALKLAGGGAAGQGTATSKRRA